MKKLNFLSTIGGTAMGLQSSDTGYRCRVVTDSLPSFCRVKMLRFISVLVLILTIGVGQIWGAEKTISVGDFTTCGASEITQTIDGFTFYCENGLIDAESFRAYSGKVFRVTSSVGSMSTIVFTFTGTAANRSWGVGAKTYTVNPNSTTWQITGPNQARITSIVITYTPSAASHTLSSAVSPSASGSVSLSATSVAEGSTATATATPATHYVFDHWSISGTGSTLSSTTANPTTITMGTANTTVTANFVAAPKASITLSEAGVTTTDASTYYVGDSYTLPSSTEASCGDKVLVGWSTVEVAETDTKPTSNYYEKGASVTLGATQTFYAVFATASGGGSSNGSKTLVSNSSSTYYSTGHITGVSGTDKATWTADAFIMTQYKNTGNAVPLNYAEIRAYQNHSLEFAPASGTTITSIVVNANSNAYATALGGSSISNCTKSASGSTVTITPTDGTATITLVQGAQSRINSIVVNYTTGGGTTYSNYATTCCTPLAQINGSVSVTNQTVSWSAVTDASGYKVKVGTGDWSDIGNVTSKTFDLPCGGDTYNVYVMAYNNNNPGHCTGDGPASNAIQVTSAACTEPAITVDPNALTGLNYIVNAGPSAAQSFNVTGSNLTGALTVKANDNYEICLTNSATAADWKSGATTLTIAEATAESQNGQNVYVRLKSGKAVGDYNSNTIKVYGGGIEEANAVNVTVSGSVLQPTLSASPNSITFGEVASTSSASQDVTVTMTNITGNVTASLTGTDAAKFSIDKNSLSSSGTITVSKNSTAVGGPYSATLSLSATGVSTVEIPISMTLIEIPTYTLKALNLIEEGDEVIIVGNNGDSYAMSNNNGTSAPTAVAVTITNNAITNPANTIIWTLSQSNSGYTFYPKGSTTTWLYCTNTNNGVKVGTETNKLFTLDESGYLKNSGTNRYVGIYSSQDWRCYTSTDGNIAGQTFSFYVKESTTPKVNISGTMNAFTYMRDSGPSAAQTFSVSGNKLTANLVVEAPENYEICATENGTYVASLNLTPENKTVSETTLYIRLKSDLAVNSYNGNITVSSTGATDATLAVAGSVTTPVYTVTLHTNGGTINAGNVTEYTEGVGATLPSDVTKDGYSFGGWFANSDLETGGVQTTIAANATGAKEYWAKWNELPGYDITWLVDGEEYTGGEPTVRVLSGGSITSLPSTPTSLDITSKTFVGWTTAQVNEKQANAPTPLYTAANQIPGNITADKEFHAVFAQETYSGTFTKVTDAATLAAGDRLLIYASNYAAGTLGSNAYLSRESVTLTNNDITNKGNASVFTLGGTSGAWTLTSAEGTLGCTAASNNSLSITSGTTTWEISINNQGNASIHNTGYNEYIQYNSNGARFSSYTNQTAVQLYREGTSLNDYTTKFVKPVAVIGVELNKDATTLAIGATETLTATVAPANATNKNVSWSSSDGSIATVEAGVVTAVAAGEATITVTTEDGSFTDECVVTVLPTVETPTFSPAAGAINKGSKVEISCGTADATILYSIDGSDPSLAYPDGGVTINANCTLKAKATKANYTTSAVAEAAYTIIKASQTVSFTESAYAFRLESDEYNAFTGQTASSTYGSAVITYASSNTSVAEVDENTGAVTLQGVKGTTTITATAAEDDDYASAQATYTITVLRAGKTRTGDFVLVKDANDLEDGDYIVLASSASNGTAYVFANVGSGTTYQTKTVADEAITYSQFLVEGNLAKTITLEKIGDNYALNFGTEDDLYIAAGTSTSAHDLSSQTSTTDNQTKWNIAIAANTHIASVTNVGNTDCGYIACNGSSHAFRAYKNLQSGSLYIYKQKDKNKTKQTLSFATPSYEFPLNESGYTGFAHQTVSGAQTAVTYTTNNEEVAAIVENTVVLQGGVGTATITATAAESEDYEHASATYTITVTAALNTVTFHYYKPADATVDQTALKEETSGAGITVPAKPANVGEYTFLGWAPATLVETQTAPNNLVAALQAGATYHPASDEEYFAIYRRLENSDGRFYLMHEVNSTPNYAKAPASSSSTNFQNTTDIAEAAIFEITEDNKLFYYEGNTPRYFSSTSTTARDIDFTPNAAEAQVWTITESGTTTTFYSSISSKYFAHNNTMWAAYASGSINQANQSKDLKQVYLAHVYYSSTPNLMVSPVLTWAQGNATYVMEIEATYDNAATATVSGEPVSVTYSSSDETKATVNNAGVVTAHLGGLVTITATVAENPGVSRQLVETYQVSITKKVPQIVFDNEANWKVYVGEAYKRVLAGQVTITTDGAVTYTLSNNATSSDFASINSTTGEVTGLSTGGQSSKYQYLYVHTAETDMYQAGEAYKQFNVLALKNQTLTFGQNAYVFEMNESVAPFVNTLSGAQTTVSYASDDSSIAEVDAESGEVTVHTNVRGTATITATAAEGQVGDDVYKQVSQIYTITVNYPKPIISVASCEFKAPFEVSLSASANATDVAMIVYTLDGSEPSYSGSVGDIYTEPITINATKTLKAIAVSNDEVESPVASATYTKLTPALTAWSFEDGAYVAVGTEQTITASEGAKVTYIISQGGVEIASATSESNVATFSFAEAGNYEVEAEARWDVENGYVSASVSRTIHVKGAVHLPVSYEGNGTGVSSEPYFSVEGAALGDYANYSNAPIQIKDNTTLTIAFLDEPSNVVFYAGKNGSPWTSTLKLQESADGSTFEDVKTFSDSDLDFSNTGYGNNNGGTKQNLNLKSTTRFVRWNYTKVNGNVALGKIAIYPKSMEPDNEYSVPIDFTGDVVVEDGVAWNITETQTIHDLTVKQGAEVWNNEAITVNNLYIEAQEGKSGQITEDESITINGNAYYDLTLNTSGTMDNSKWYAFAVPFQVDAATGIQRLSNDGVASPAGFNSHYVLLKYNSAAYASTGEGWEYVNAGETLEPGKFYMIALNSNAYNRVRMTKKAGAAVNNKADLTLSLVGTGVHANWNALANNALAYANVSATGDNADLKVQVYNSATDNYTPYAYNKVTFTVGTPFFLQAAEAGTMSVNIAASNNETVKAPQREAVATEEFQIRLGENTESYYDILYVSASDEALNEYQIGHDLAKAGVSTSVPQMYVPAYGAKLCDAEFPLENNEATFPLTFTAPNAGTYQIYVAEAAQDAELYLLQNNSIVWNLTLSPYEIALPQGTTEGYGLMLRANAPSTATGVDEVQSDNVQCTKVVIDDHVYILRGGQLYGIDGKTVR